MKTIIFTLLLFYSFCTYSQYGKDTIFTRVTSDSIVIKHNKVTRDCGTIFVMSATRNGNVITVLETDTSHHHYRCLCLYDMSITLGMLPSGSYNVLVYDHGVDSVVYPPDTLLAGTTSFIISKKKSGSDSLTVISHYFSGCYKGVSVQVYVNANYKFSNYPNPFDNKTTISFELKMPSVVSLKLYNYSGKEVASLINTNMTKGKHEIEYNNKLLKSGIYFLHLITNENTETIKVSVIRN